MVIKNPAKTKVMLVLHAHLPYTRIPNARFPLQELWLFQNLTECYIPLLLSMNELVREDIDFNITLSLSPTLIAMLCDNYYLEKYEKYLDVLLDLFNKKSLLYNTEAGGSRIYFKNKIERIQEFYDHSGREILSEFHKYAKSGKINLITSCATHALLPAFRFNEQLIRLQVETGINKFEEVFGFKPEGLWLPEMGYFTMLDKILIDSGIKYTFLDTHSIYKTKNIPEYGNFFPSITENGLYIFPRDFMLTNEIWSKHAGYPGDPRYREFHYDYTYSLSDEELSEEQIDKIPFGLKLYKITGGTNNKEFYRQEDALEAIKIHSEDFLDKTRNRSAEVRELIKTNPLFILPFDAELFGHWWYEGPEFLSRVIKNIAVSSDITLASPEDYLHEKSCTIISPAESSWGKNGYFETWLSPDYIHVYMNIADLFNRLNPFRNKKNCIDAVNCAQNEILLAQSSDWSFYISWDNFGDYGKIRIKEHLQAAEKIILDMENGNTDEGYVKERMDRYPIFFKLCARPSIP